MGEIKKDRLEALNQQQVNFIAKNTSQINQGRTIADLIKRKLENDYHANKVNERCQVISKQGRENILEAILKRKMSRQVKEDEMVFHKNWIFRKCRHVALVAYCKIHQVLRILSDHLRRRTAQILAAFRTRMACNAIVKCSRRWLSRCTLYEENNFRHTFTFVSRSIVSTKRFER